MHSIAAHARARYLTQYVRESVCESTRLSMNTLTQIFARNTTDDSAQDVTDEYNTR